MEDCLFCDIIAGKTKGEIIKENEFVVAFRDINPMAPVHALIVPKKHIATLNDVAEEDAELISQAVFMAREVAEDEGMADSLPYPPPSAWRKIHGLATGLGSVQPAWPVCSGKTCLISPGFLYFAHASTEKRWRTEGKPGYSGSFRSV